MKSEDLTIENLKSEIEKLRVAKTLKIDWSDGGGVVLLKTSDKIIKLYDFPSYGGESTYYDTYKIPNDYVKIIKDISLLS